MNSTIFKQTIRPTIRHLLTVGIMMLMVLSLFGCAEPSRDIAPRPEPLPAPVRPAPETPPPEHVGPEEPTPAEPVQTEPGDTPPPEPGDEQELPETEEPSEIEPEAPVAMLDVEASDEEIQAVVEANNKFAIDLYKEHIGTDENVFFSPYSISTALAMTYEGAKGDTAAEMEEVFHYPEGEVLRLGSAGMYNMINAPGKSYQLKTGNALWAQQDYEFLPEYFDVTSSYYGGTVRNMDFVGEPEESRVVINDWVEEQTNDKIKDLIPAGVLGPLTRLVLTNAVYFKGSWKLQFKPEDTHDAEFDTGSGVVTVDMMSRTDKEAMFPYMENELLQMVELPYKGEELSMLVLLPKGDIYVIDASLNTDTLEMWKGQMYEQEIDLYLPKFKFETKYMMQDTLASMGMPLAFDPENADFSGMDGSRDLFIHAVVHQAYVDVNEEGTEAAAATGVMMGVASAPRITEFRADHPFVFIIQQKETGNILFMGKVMDPSAE